MIYLRGEIKWSLASSLGDVVLVIILVLKPRYCELTSSNWSISMHRLVGLDVFDDRCEYEKIF